MALRIWGAWMNRYMPNPDYGIAALMSRHMAQGDAWPVFFYGQAYMGSLEPFFSAMLCKVFGISSFVVSLGTALLGWLCLPFIYAWARDAAGARRAGWAAMLFCLYGTDTWYHYNASSRGGYALMMLCGVAILWLSGVITTKLRMDKPVHATLFALLGLSAGIAWWTLQLAIVFLSASALTLTICLRKRVLHKGFLISFAFFILGSLPWWYWNATHGWATFALGGSWGAIPFTEGWAGFLRVLGRTLEPATDFRPAIIFTWGMCALGCIGFAFHTVFVLVKGRQRLLAPTLLVWAVVAFMVLFFCRSHFALLNATRYLLPLYPACAVMLGVFTCQLSALLPRQTGWIPIVLVALLHIPFPLSIKYKQVRESASTWAQGPRLAAEAAAQGWDVVYADFLWNWMNFASGEEVTVVTAPTDRYAPYTLRGAQSAHTAYLHNPQHIRTFLHDTGATYKEWAQHGIYIIHDIIPPEAPPGILIRPEPKDAALHILSDGILDSEWTRHIAPGETTRLDWAFKTPVTLHGLRLLFREKRLPDMIGIDILDENGTYIPLAPVEPCSRWFWSGPKAYCDGLQSIKPFDFPARSVSGLRFIFTASSKRPNDVACSEILLLGPSAETPASSRAPDTIRPAIAVLKSWLKTNAIDRLYAHRFVSEVLHQDAGIRCQLFIPSYYHRAINDLPCPDEPVGLTIDLSGRPAFLVEHAYAQNTLSNLLEAGVGVGLIPMGPWTLMDTGGAETNVSEEPSFLYWTEAGCFKAGQHIFAKARAEALFRAGRKALDTGHEADAITAWTEALDHWPAYPEAKKALTPYTETSGVASQALRKAYETLSPAIPVNASFPRGIILAGITLSTNTPPVKRSFQITYFWQCPPDVDPSRYAVFVHFERDGHRFQDDRVFMEFLDPRILTYQPAPDIFMETRIVTVPREMPDGTYTMRLGLYDRKSGKRLNIRAPLPVMQKAVVLESLISIGSDYISEFSSSITR
ncbi:MAG: hypothetical protein EOM20_11710 [Spartobacteria bacterium]|nr:hypothetical protein [Spartobacteria bacterium]